MLPADTATTPPSLLRSTAGRVVLTVLVAWFVVAIVRPPSTAQDAVPLVVAGELLLDEPEQVYVERDGSLFDLQPAFEQRSCELLRRSLDCDRYAVAFVSPPPALPLVLALSWLGPTAAIVLLRLLGAGALGLGVIALWRRLAGWSSEAPAILALSTVLLTPLALISLGLGQTTPLLFASVALGVTALDRSRSGRWLVAGVWVATIAFKAVSAVVGVVLLVQRRWRLLGTALGLTALLGGIGVLLGRPAIVGEFLTGTSAVSLQATENPYNGSVEAALYHLPLVSMEIGTAEAVGMGLRVAVLLAAVPLFLRLRDSDVQWAFAWSVLLVVTPLVWWHYSVVLFGALAVAIARSAQPARWLPLLPVMLLVGMPMSIANNRGWSLPTAQWVFALGTVGLVGWLGARHGRVSAAEEIEPAG